MKKMCVVILLTLTACGKLGPNYQPNLIDQPKDSAKYDADRKSCIATTIRAIKDKEDDYFNRAMSGDLTLEEKMVGLAPPPILLMSASDDTPMGRVDNCMSKKGYHIAPR